MAFRIAEDESLAILTVSPKTDMDGTQKVEKDTKWPIYTLQVLHTPTGGGKAALINVSYASATPPVVVPLESMPTGVEVDHYSMAASGNRAGASGLWFKCSGIAEVD